jgi:hypothetical protein
MAAEGQTETREAPVGDPFAGNGAPPEPEVAEQPTGPEPDEPASTGGDLSREAAEHELRQAETSRELDEQRQVLAQKLAAQPEPSAGEEPEDPGLFQTSDGGWVDGTGAEVDPAEVRLPTHDGREVDGYGQPVDPRLDVVLDYLDQRAAADHSAEVDALVEQYSDLDTREGVAEVERRIERLAQRGVDVNDVGVLEQVFDGARYAIRAAATAAAPSPDEARREGATLSTNAGAAVSTAKDPDAAWWDQVKGAGRSAFGD